MASTILRQILENVERGALLPLSGSAPPAQRPAPDGEPIARILHSACTTFLERVDDELERLVARMARHPALVGVSSPPRADPETSRALDAEELRAELRDLRRAIEGFPSQLDGRGTQTASREILDRLNHLSQEVEDLRQRPASEPSRDGSPAAARKPEAKRIQVGDIQGMIDSLLAND